MGNVDRVAGTFLGSLAQHQGAPHQVARSASRDRRPPKHPSAHDVVEIGEDVVEEVGSEDATAAVEDAGSLDLRA